MTNQASEDKLRQSINKANTIAALDKLRMDVVQSKSQEILVLWQAKYWERKKKYTFSEVQDLIRTEKLKLLAAVRERVVGEGEIHVSHVCPQDNIGCAKFSQRCQTRNHQNAELTKLEAEL